jgi:hypothetical protein
MSDGFEFPNRRRKTGSIMKIEHRKFTIITYYNVELYLSER